MKSPLCILGIFLLTVFSAIPSCLAATIEVTYEDRGAEGFYDETLLTPVKGFYDETPLTEEEKNLYSRYGNDAETWGELRRNAFGYAADLLASKLVSENIIRVTAIFAKLDREPCPEVRSFVSAHYALGPDVFFLDRLEEGDPSASAEEDRVGLGIAYPITLAEALSGQELNGQDTDITLAFEICSAFAYSLQTPQTFSGSQLKNAIADFVSVALHEMIHGLGFASIIPGSAGDYGDGDFLGALHNDLRIVEADEADNYYSFVLWEDGYGYTRGNSISSLRGISIYDAQLYSKKYEELLIYLSGSQRKALMNSDDDLVWEGTDEGRNPCSYGQRMAELQPDSAKDQDGRPKLFTSSTFFAPGHTASHPVDEARDVMSTNTRNMDLALGMLKDIGWEISDEGFPPSCVPTGITVTPILGLVTTEEGRTASFTVKLDSEPMSTVIIPVRSTEPDEGVVTPQMLEFTAGNWNMEQTVTVEGVNDDEPDGPRDYFIELGEVQSDDRFYSGFDPQDVSVTNDEEIIDSEEEIIEEEPPHTPGTVKEGGGSGCAVAAGADHQNKSVAVNLFLIMTVLFSAFFRKSRLTAT